jgi:hypothetical protein
MLAWPSSKLTRSSGSRACYFGGASRDRTDDLIVANDALSQLSYSPTRVGEKGSAGGSKIARFLIIQTMPDA